MPANSELSPLCSYCCRGGEIVLVSEKFPMLSGRTSRSLLNALSGFLAAPESVLLLRSTALTNPAINLALGGADWRIFSGRALTRLQPGAARCNQR
jgi:hypothetical protein